MKKRKRITDTELKELLQAAVAAADARYQKGHFKRPAMVAENAPFRVEKMSVFVYTAVHRRMVKAHVWRQALTLFAKTGIERIRLDVARKRERLTEDPSQLCLPGFEHLPKRIRSGRESLVFAKATVGQFLKYKERYEQRSEKNQLVVEELRRLAQAVAPFAQNEANLTLSEALQRAKGTGAPARLAIV